MPGNSFRYETFTVTREGDSFVARDDCGSDDFMVLEIESDSLDTLFVAMGATIQHGRQRTAPGERPTCPAWYAPYVYDGDCARIILPSRDQKRLYAMARASVGALVGVSVAVAVWAVVSGCTHPLLVAVGPSAVGTL